MKYLFFDIECSNCFDRKGKICEFGYVITDDKFKVISKHDIPISPGNKNNRKNRFDTTIYKRDSSFAWAYEYDYYFSCLEFPFHYDLIKRKFLDKETLLFGFSAENDIRYLYSEFERYSLKPFRFKVIDIQKLLKQTLNKDGKYYNLKDAFIKMCGENELINLSPHLSRDDAYMTMRIFQEIISKTNLTIENIKKVFPDCYIDSEEYMFNYRNKLIGKSKERTVKIENQNIWRDFCNSYLSEIQKDESKGRTCTITKVIKEDKERLIDVINYIKNEHLIPCNKIDDSYIMIVFDEEDERRMKGLFKRPYDGNILTYVNDIQKEKIPLMN